MVTQSITYQTIKLSLQKQSCYVSIHSIKCIFCQFIVYGHSIRIMIRLLTILADFSLFCEVELSLITYIVFVQSMTLTYKITGRSLYLFFCIKPFYQHFR